MKLNYKMLTIVNYIHWHNKNEYDLLWTMFYADLQKKSFKATDAFLAISSLLMELLLYQYQIWTSEFLSFKLM